jgi:hypothetical protein
MGSFSISLALDVRYESQWMSLSFLSKKKVTKEKSRGLVIFFEKFVLRQGQ